MKRHSRGFYYEGTADRPPVLGVCAVRRCWRSVGPVSVKRWQDTGGEQPSAHRAQWSVSAAAAAAEASTTLDYHHTEVSMFLDHCRMWLLLGLLFWRGSFFKLSAVLHAYLFLFYIGFITTAWCYNLMSHLRFSSSSFNHQVCIIRLYPAYFWVSQFWFGISAEKLSGCGTVYCSTDGSIRWKCDPPWVPHSEAQCPGDFPHTEVWEPKGFADFTPCEILPWINFKKTNYSCAVWLFL